MATKEDYLEEAIAAARILRAEDGSALFAADVTFTTCKEMYLSRGGTIDEFNEALTADYFA